MERENFYILLELSIDPPETDPKKIANAIKKMQAKWSRFRNHPTKAVQAKKYIGMIPEIRKIMSNPDLRQNEAQEAKKQFKQKKEEKFSKIDRHISICMSKGFVTKEETFKLAKLHSIDESEIHERIKQKKEEKFSEIDKHLNIRMGKGYITDEEIAKLAKLHSTEIDEIRKRVKCPIRKKAKEKISKTKHLDKSIVKVINDNLKIVGKPSLYKFLELPTDASLEKLQEKAKKKEKETINIGKKDAFATACEILAGQCIAVFKSEESRNAYDISRAQSNLNDLNSDIDVAGMNGKIRAEYFEILVKRAIEFGMDRVEAIEYINKYCNEKKWIIEKTKNKNRVKIFFAVLTALILAVSAGGLIWAAKEKKNKDKYQKVLARVENTKKMEEKKNILNNYIKARKKDKYRSSAENMLKKILNLIEDQDYTKILNKADKLCKNKKFDEATSVYAQYIMKYPKGNYTDKINKKIAEVSALIDETDYNLLKDAKFSDVNNRISIYLEYLRKHPNGIHRNDAKKLLSDINREYYIFVKKEIYKSKAQENWEKAIELCSKYINIYPEDQKSSELKTLKYLFQKEDTNKKIVANLKLKADAEGDNYEAAVQIYLDYIQAYPDSDTALKNKIIYEIQRLNKLKEYARIQAEKENIRSLVKKNSRFIEKKEGVLTDTRTGLMWCLIDSQTDLGKCLDYESAIEYVKGLKTGGFKDWRVPDTKELAEIYKSKPFFPSDGKRWYWTSESYKRYMDGWSEVVETVTSKKETKWNKKQTESWECGTVHAVRP